MSLFVLMNFKSKFSLPFLVFLVLGSNASVENENAKLQRTNAILMKALSAISEEVTVSQNEEVSGADLQEAEVGDSGWFKAYRNTNVCKWFGTAPFCESGSGCPSGKDLEVARTVKKRNTLPEGLMLDQFGSSCWTGSKILCCKRIV